MELFLNKKFYKNQAIRGAMKAFQSNGFGDFELKSTPDMYKVRGSCLSKREEECLKNEFCNFVLALMKK